MLLLFTFHFPPPDPQTKKEAGKFTDLFFPLLLKRNLKESKSIT